ncbi:Na+/H+ antiporter NhaA [Actinomadura hallensis]|uniref:Na+/H+ antiporter NhaA n=1 Tax=Actinomadura hallensis TaxID=337895 RepID=UPI0024829EB3|nr:Na+/H+ antiporter NhaA [Actinomadura hallensis]
MGAFDQGAGRPDGPASSPRRGPGRPRGAPQEIAKVAFRGGVGFTISLLIGGLAYTDPSQFERVTTAVLIASVLAVGGRGRRLPENGRVPRARG